MDALRLTGWGTDAELQDVPQPDPGPGEVLVRIGGAGACHSDLHLMHDFVEGVVPWGPPFTLGHENAGWVHALGAGVTGLEVGQPVAVYGPWGCGRCHRCRMGAENYCERAAELPAAGGGLGFDGGMAPYQLIPQSRWLVPLGDLDPVDAAPLTDAGLTPYHAIKRSLGVLIPGSTVVVIGAGGLGHMAVQILAALTPATIVVVDQRLDALERTTAYGATHTIFTGEGGMTQEEAVAEVMSITGGRGADVTIDVVGVDATLALGAAVTRSLGHLTIVGIGGGTLPVNFFSVQYEVSIATTYWGTLPELQEVLALAERGLIEADVQRFDLAHAPDAYRAMAAGELHGRAVVVPS